MRTASLAPAAPRLVSEAGAAARFAWDEFIYAEHHDPYTQRAYQSAVRRFLAWCDGQGTALLHITPGMVGQYLAGLGGSAAKHNLRPSALRCFFDRRVQRHVVVLNSVASVKGVEEQVIEGKTPEITLDQPRTLGKIQRQVSCTSPGKLPAARRPSLAGASRPVAAADSCEGLSCYPTGSRDASTSLTLHAKPEVQNVKRESIDPSVSRLCLAILDGDKDAILLLADRLRELGYPNANRVRAVHSNLYYSAPRDESVAVLLALPDEIGWRLACDFADHWMTEIHADTSPQSKHSQIVHLCRGRATGQLAEERLAQLLENAPGYYQSWARARNGNEAASNALCGVLAFSATGGREPAWQHCRIREYLLCDGACD